MEQMTGCKIQPSPEAFLLNLWPEEDVPRHQEKTIFLLLSLAKTEVASKWKSTSSPSLSSWYDRLWKGFLLAKVTDRILRSTSKSYRSTLESTWLPVLGYLADNKIISSKYSDITF